ncbi:MAG: hypothetical protein J6A15_09830 [Clostridia bacterium]|nr:hypothetical protein [Clostridia bacterium]
MKKIFRKGNEDLLETLRNESYGSRKFEKAVQKAYMSNSFDKYLVGTNLVFEQGANRRVSIPADIVEDIIGVELQVSRRAA